MLFKILPFAALALLSTAVVAHPANEQDAKGSVDFPDFPEFAGLGSLETLAEGDIFDSDMDVDDDGEGEGGIEARAANQCSLAKLKEIMFDWSESRPFFPLLLFPFLTLPW